MTAKREYSYALLVGAVGAVVVLFAVREQWAQAVFTPPKPLTTEVVSVSGTDLVPLAGGLGLAALAGLVAVIATRGVVRRAVGVLLALFGAGAGAAVLTRVSAQTVVSVAAGKVASPESAALSGAAGSTTGGSSGGSALVITGSSGHAIMTGTPWQLAVIIGALLIFAAGLATALRGQDWPVMSARYDAPGAQHAAAGRPARAADAATMWESLNGGEDPTDDPGDDPAGDDADDPAGAATRR
ncbi:MAG: Trp biosynthesis-associated membrane protein [Trebonia sp.]